MYRTTQRRHFERDHHLALCLVKAEIERGSLAAVGFAQERNARIAAEESELPPGVLNVLLGGHGDVGEVLCTHPMVDQVTFTGSTTTGKRIMASAASTLKRLTLELGGKSANVIFEDADVEAASKAAASSTTGASAFEICCSVVPCEFR